MTRYQSNTKPTWAGPHPVQNAQAKLGFPPGERRQRDPAMGRDEEAGLIGGIGCPMGLGPERASPHRAKLSGRLLCLPALPAQSVSRLRGSNALQDVMFQQWLSFFTGEVPRRPGLQNRVTPRYKQSRKAGLTRRCRSARLWPVGFGDVSSARVIQGFNSLAERQNLRRPPIPLASTGPVTSPAQAPKSPDGTSSRQPGGQVSNSLHGLQRPKRWFHSS